MKFSLKTTGLCALAFMSALLLEHNFHILERVFPSPATFADNQLYQPCIENTAVEGRFTMAIAEWDAMYVAKTGQAPIGTIVPDGRYAGTSIPTRCFAVESYFGHLTFYQRPYTSFGDRIAAWNPHPNAYHRQNKE